MQNYFAGKASRAPAVESYPTDNGGQKVDTTMAFVGTRDMFERAGFFPRILMRRMLD